MLTYNVSMCWNGRGHAYSRAGVDLPQAFVCESIVSTKTVRRAEGLVALAARVFLQDLQYNVKCWLIRCDSWNLSG